MCLKRISRKVIIFLRDLVKEVKPRKVYLDRCGRLRVIRPGGEKVKCCFVSCLVNCSAPSLQAGTVKRLGH